jgi:hypothetical protein
MQGAAWSPASASLDGLTGIWQCTSAAPPQDLRGSTHDLGVETLGPQAHLGAPIQDATFSLLRHLEEVQVSFGGGESEEGLLQLGAISPFQLLNEQVGRPVVVAAGLRESSAGAMMLFRRPSFRCIVRVELQIGQGHPERARPSSASSCRPPVSMP